MVPVPPPQSDHGAVPFINKEADQIWCKVQQSRSRGSTSSLIVTHDFLLNLVFNCNTPVQCTYEVMKRKVDFLLVDIL